MYLESFMAHSPSVHFTEAASFVPFDGQAGVNVATTSTIIGADILVSGVAQQNRAAQVRKYQLLRPSAEARTMEAKQVGQVSSAAGSNPKVVGGD
jgi:hypothetical protein